MSTGEEPVDPCCKDMAAALSFETGRHFFVEAGELKLLVAHTPLLDGGEEGTGEYRALLPVLRQADEDHVRALDTVGHESCSR